MKNTKPTDVIHKDVVIIGNGPSGLALSYMLSGNLPYLISTSHPDELLSARLRNTSSSSLIHQDLMQLASNIEGRSTNPISVLLDALTQPYADVGLELNSLIKWQKDGVEIDHVVLGKGPPGGTWHKMDPNILTLSLGRWMALPGLPYRARDGSEKRASAGNVAKYYLEYVKEMDLEKYFISGVSVTKIIRINIKDDTNAEKTINHIEIDKPLGTEIRRQKLCPLSNAFNFIRFRSNRSCKRRRDVLMRNDSNSERKIRDVLQRPVSLSDNRLNQSISSSKDVEDVPQSIDLCYAFGLSRPTSFSCDCDNFQSLCDNRCSNFLNEQGSFINSIRSSCSLDFKNSICKVPRTSSTCDNDPIRLKENCDPSTSRASGDKPNWLVEVYNATTGSYIKYTCNHLVLANGTSDLPNKLSISEKENPLWLVHDVRSLELALDLYLLKNSSNPDPVVVVGAGLSAADAIIATRCRNIPVLHVFRGKHGNLAKHLPENMYPEYHKVHQMMQDGGSTYPLYTALPESSLTDVNTTNRSITVTTNSDEELKFHVSFVAVLIGTRPDLSFVPPNFKLGVHKSLPIDNKTNNVNINKSNYAVNGIDNLYAMGPLAGDNFVRFIPGGALAIVSDLYKKYRY